MYYVPDGTTKCGFYECKCCRSRFLSLQTMKKIPCPYCEQDADMEIGPDESMEELTDTAELQEIVEGENVRKWIVCSALQLQAGTTSGCNQKRY